MNAVRRGMLGGLLILVLAVATPLVVRWVSRPPTGEPTISIVLLGGSERVVDLEQMKRLAPVVRRGEVQNQFGNWRDAGTYTGVLLADLLRGLPFDVLDVVAVDGYRASIDRSRLDDTEYPIVLAYAFNDVQVPDWADGFRLVVLPEDGRVSNEEYNAASAGGYWVKNVVRIVLE